MPKQILFESTVHQFLWAGSRLQARLRATAPEQARAVAAWLAELRFDQPGAGQLRLAWPGPHAGEHLFDFKLARFYTRGDTAVHRQRQEELGLLSGPDPVMAANRQVFDATLRTALAAARILEGPALAAAFPADSPTGDARDPDQARKAAEQAFHDQWAESERATAINVRQRNEACTAPEMRHLRRSLGDLRGKTLLDVGCGLGEASVYFALEGARVTATDVAPGMCAATQRLAAAEGVTLETHVSAAEDLRLGDRQFDLLYVGNTLHHVALADTLDRLLPHLHPEGTFASWDPVAYNPLINIYRRVATAVRTPDEHPLRLRDIRTIAARFETCEIRYFWLTTLLIFVCMVVFERRNPNRVRFWKLVIDDADRWRWLYTPLEALDTFLLKWLPFLRPLCWNVVIVGRRPLRPTPTRHA
jgi:2-polyprenyl-3-methyl-5-hydroxy-6-metoxy-1,4-benzoquinol methylase